MRKTVLLIVTLGVLAGLAWADDAEAGPRKRRRNIPQERQNQAAKRHDLTQLKDRAHLERFIAAGLLVRVPDRAGVYYLETVGEMDPAHADLYAYARPFTKRLIDRELETLSDKFGGTYKIVALVRTKAYQRKVCRKYRSAICGNLWWQQSAHLTGAAVDISFDGMSRKAKVWFRKRLRQLQGQGKVIYIEENGCFHVMVQPSYDKAKPKKAKKPVKKKPKKRRRAR